MTESVRVPDRGEKNWCGAVTGSAVLEYNINSGDVMCAQFTAVTAEAV